MPLPHLTTTCQISSFKMTFPPYCTASRFPCPIRYKRHYNDPIKNICYLKLYLKWSMHVFKELFLDTRWVGERHHNIETYPWRVLFSEKFIFSMISHLSNGSYIKKSFYFILHLVPYSRGCSRQMKLLLQQLMHWWNNKNIKLHKNIYIFMLHTLYHPYHP